jgi:hypothetical protein
MTTANRNRKIVLIVVAILICAAILIGLVSQLPLTRVGNGDNQPLAESVSAIGNFVQTSDGGFAIVGTSSDGKVTILKT